MRWKQKIKKQPVRGSEREISLFLLWPRTIDGETRWLERATIIQRYGPTFEEAVAKRLRRYVVKWHDQKWGKDYYSIRHWLTDHPFPIPDAPK